MANNENTKEIIKDIVKNLTDNFSFDSLKDLFRSLPNKTFKPIEEDIFYLYENLFNNNNDKNIFEYINIFGELELEEGDFCIIVCKVKNELKERSSKKKQYDLAKTFLKRKNKYIGGFFIFYDENSNFRFSLVYEIYFGKGKRGFSDFKRFTYYVSKDQTNKTFIEQFSEAGFSSISSIIEAFSVEKVTKIFYKEIANWYFWALKKSRFPDDCEFEKNGRNIALLRLITRLIFIWFMKEKSLIKDDLFDEAKLKNILVNFNNENDNYYKAILQNLFFATLNTPINERNYEQLNKNIESEKVRQVFKFHSKFKDIKIIKEIFEKIPFLNGGLFECLDMNKDHPLNDNGRYTYIDGFTEYKENQPKLPNYLFFDENDTADLHEDYQDIKYNKTNVRGIINILKSYNFTIEENSPIDQEVALDPELLGKVFENLLASYNPETSTTARKATGSFYTPREIVDYMVESTLIEYFKTNLKDKIDNIDDKLINLFDINKSENPFDEEQTDEIISLIEKVKILDPAVGSGAFLMSALHSLTFILSKLDPHNKKWKEKNIEAIEKSVFDPILKKELIEKVYENFNNNELDYGRKLYIIQHCLYGVDIQQIAIQISKLRFFISLLVDEKIDKNSFNFGLEPLPNLETKLVCANSLISLDDKDEKNLFESNVYKELEDQLFSIREQYFSASDMKKKDTLKEEDRKTRRKIESTYLDEKGKNFPEQIKEKLLKIARWDPYQIITSSDWFDPFWMFGVKDGFDIVIGNPPYISTKGVDDKDKKIFEQQFGFADDLYNHFYFKGIQLLKEKGILAYISSKTFWTIQTKKNLRKLILKNKLLQLVDTANPFESAMVDTCITIVQKDKVNDYEIHFIDISNGWDKKQEYKVKDNVYKNVVNNVFFKPNELNMKIYERVAKNIKPLIEKWWDKISTSKNIEKYKRELEQYRQSLKPGDITLLGLITEGGQGLATANNGKFIGVLEGTKWADKVRQERSQKLFEFIEKFSPKELSAFKSKNQIQNYLNNLSENQIRELFDSLKEKYGRDIFGQGWLYRIVSQDEIADVEKLTDDEKLNGINGNKTFAPYDKGDKDGNRWWAPTPYYIDWRRENVKFLKENSGKKGEGMPVVRNPQFYFREGFCWTDVNSTYLKSRIKENGVYDVLTMSLFTKSNLPDCYYVCMINSKFISEYVDDFVNSTSHFQINDARQLPIIIPASEQLKEFELIFDRAKRVQEEKFSGKISEKEAEERLEKIQMELDEKVMELYGLK